MQSLAGLASSPYQQTFCNLSLDLPALFIWIKLLQSISRLASSFYLDQTSCNHSGLASYFYLASSPYLDQTSCNLSLDCPALHTWIKLLAISLWIGQLSIPGSNFLQSLSGLASSKYSRRKKIWPFCIFFVNSDTGMNQKTFISS